MARWNLLPFFFRKIPEPQGKEAVKTGPAAGEVNELDKMLPNYYEPRGWSAEGVPTAEIRKRLGF